MLVGGGISRWRGEEYREAVCPLHEVSLLTMHVGPMCVSQCLLGTVVLRGNSVALGHGGWSRSPGFFPLSRTLKYLGLSVHWVNEGNACGWWWVRAQNNCKVLLGCYDESHARHIKEVLGPMTCSSCVYLGVLCLLLWARQRWDHTAHVHWSVPKDTPAAWQRGFPPGAQPHRSFNKALLPARDTGDAKHSLVPLIPFCWLMQVLQWILVWLES